MPQLQDANIEHTAEDGTTFSYRATVHHHWLNSSQPYPGAGSVSTLS
jgi:hypothetical protein